MSTAERWGVRHPGIGILYYDSEQEARIAAGTAGEFLGQSPAPVGDLYPTPTRLALLRGVDRREVTGYPQHESAEVAYYWDGDGGGRRVTKRTEELIRAGWVQKGVVRVGDIEYPTHSMRLTEAGRKVLEEADRG